MMPKLSVRPNISYNTPPAISKESANHCTKASEASLGIYAKTHSDMKSDGTEGRRVPSARSGPSVLDGGSLRSQGHNVYVLERKARPPSSARGISQTRMLLRFCARTSSNVSFQMLAEGWSFPNYCGLPCSILCKVHFNVLRHFRHLPG